MRKLVFIVLVCNYFLFFSNSASAVASPCLLANDTTEFVLSLGSTKTFCLGTLNNISYSFAYIGSTNEAKLNGFPPLMTFLNKGEGVNAKFDLDNDKNETRDILLTASLGPGNPFPTAATTTVRFTVLAQPTEKSSLSSIVVFPNPFDFSNASHKSQGITFYDLTPFNLSRVSASVKIYDASGSLIRTVTATNKGFPTGIATWDGKNEDGQEVSMGLYFYVIRDAQGNKVATGKIGMIKR